MVLGDTGVSSDLRGLVLLCDLSLLDFSPTLESSSQAPGILHIPLCSSWKEKILEKALIVEGCMLVK